MKQLFEGLEVCIVILKCMSVFSLKAVDTFGNCQRLASRVGVSQHMHKKTNKWKFEFNRSSKLRDNNEKKILVTRSCVHLDQVLNLRSQNQIRGNLLLSRKLRHFRESRFSQCFIPSTSPYYSSPRQVYANNYFE